MSRIIAQVDNQTSDLVLDDSLGSRRSGPGPSLGLVVAQPDKCVFVCPFAIASRVNSVSLCSESMRVFGCFRVERMIPGIIVGVHCSSGCFLREVSGCALVASIGKYPALLFHEHWVDSSQEKRGSYEPNLHLGGGPIGSASTFPESIEIVTSLEQVLAFVSDLFTTCTFCILASARRGLRRLVRATSPHGIHASSASERHG